MRVCVDTVGVMAPGLAGWREAQAVLTGEASLELAPLSLPPLEMLPPPERRRAPGPVRVALAAIADALERSSVPTGAWRTVFASSDGDGEILQGMCLSLAAPEPAVSPTRFHNSVHNATAGYWSIAVGARGASCSVCAYVDTFAAGLLEAAAYVVVEREPVLLVAFDLPFPPPLSGAHAVRHPFGCAIGLVPAPTPSALAEWEISFDRAGTATPFPEACMEAFGDNPSARALPLLSAIAHGHAGESCAVVLRCQRGAVRIAGARGAR